MLSDDGFFEDELPDRVAALNDLLKQVSPDEIEAFLRGQGQYEKQLRDLLPTLDALSSLQDPPSNTVEVIGLADMLEFARLPAGAVLKGSMGDFRLIRKIGVGGMGTVYEAEQVSLSRRVALKLLLPAHVLDESQIARFHNEALAVSRLNHPNIVQVYGVTCDRDMHYIAMQYIDGCDLATWLTKHTTWLSHSSAQIRNRSATRHRTWQSLKKSDFTRHERWVAEAGINIAEALAHAHQCGIAHRDVKPANLLLDQGGKIWLTDFGVARCLDLTSLTNTGDLLGTLRYMSPEQALGGPESTNYRSADIYALAVTLYELLLGEPMRTGSDRFLLLQQVLRREAPELRHRQPWVSPKLEAILMRAIHPKPDHRHQTAREFAEELRAFLEDRPLPKRPTFSLQGRGLWTWRMVRLRPRGQLPLIGIGLLVFYTMFTSLRVSEQLGDEQAIAEQNTLPTGTRWASKELYVSNLQQASQEWEGIDWNQMRQRLVDCLPKDGEEDLRCFVWHFLCKMLDGTPKPFGMHAGEVYSLAESPTEQILASAGEDGIRIWDLRTWRLLRHLREHQSDVNSVAFSDKGRRLVSCSDDGSVRIYDSSSWECVHVVRGFERVVAAFQIQNSGNLVLIDRKDATEMGRTSRILRYSLETNSILWCIDLPGEYVQNMSLDSDGRLAAITSEPHWLRLVDIDSGKILAESSTPSGIPMAVDIDSTGEFVASSTDKSILLWRTGEIDQSPVLQIDGISGSPESLKFTDDGDLISASRDGYAAWWKLDWDSGVPAPRSCRRFKHDQALWNARVIRDSQSLISADRQGRLTRWNLCQPTAREPLMIPRSDVIGADVGIKRKLASCISSFHLSDDQTTAHFPLAPAQPSSFSLHDNSRSPHNWLDEHLLEAVHVYEVCPSPNRHLVALRTNRDVRVIAPHEGNSTLLAKLPIASAACWSPDSSQLLMASGWPIKLSIFNASSGESSSINLERFRPTGAVAWLSDGSTILIASSTGSIIIWDLISSQTIDSFLTHRNGIQAMAVSPDERVLATTDGNSVTVWNLATRRPLLQLTLPAETDELFSLKFSQDGSRLGAEAGPRGVAERFLVWEANSGQMPKLLPNSSPTL